MTSDLDNYKVGDRVKVEIEGDVSSISGDFLAITLVRGEGECIFTAEERQSPGFKLERIEAPLAVGSVVRGKGFVSSRRRGHILSIQNNLAWVRWEPSSMTPEEHVLICIDSLEVAP